MPIESLEPGVAGNVRANTINTVSGALRFRVRVINPNGTAGGGSRLVPIVTQQDKDTLLAQAQAKLETRAFDTLQQELEPGRMAAAGVCAGLYNCPSVRQVQR